MFCLTRQEKIVLWMVSTIVLTGSMLQWVFKRYPDTNQWISQIDSSNLYQKIDVNTATFKQLVDIPYIGDYTAQVIIDYRQEHGSIRDLSELKTLRGIKEKNFEKFFPFLKIVKK